MSPDRMPYAGRYSAAAPQWYVASGFDKWGMTRAMWAARQISGMICGQNTNGLPVRRINLATAGAVLKNGVQSVKGLTRVYFAAAPQLAQLPRGHGGIFTLDGRKTGAYRDDQGRLMLVDPRCTHLGCLLTWNPDERSWDCPCHGSRFDPSGAVLTARRSWRSNAGSIGAKAVNGNFRIVFCPAHVFFVPGHDKGEVIKMILSQKETMLLQDLKTQEQLCVDKYNKYANQACDGQLKQLFLPSPRWSRAI